MARFEYKYLLNQHQHHHLRSILVPLAQADPHHDSSGSYLVSSEYWDSADLKFFWQKWDGDLYHAKIRRRWYGTTQSPTPHWEAKWKWSQWQTKKKRLTGNQSLPPEELLPSRGVAPTCTITYRRSAYALDQLRFNFDFQIEVKNLVGTNLPILPSDQFLLEIKSPHNHLPGWLLETLDHHGAYWQAFSKYGEGLRQLRARSHHLLGQLLCVFLLFTGCGKESSNERSQSTATEDSDNCTEDKAVCIEHIKQDGGVAFRVVTGSYGWSSVRITLTETENLSSSVGSIYEGSFSANSDQEVFRLSPINEGEPFSYSFSWRMRIGESGVTATPATYSLPWASTKSYRVTQGYGGTFSHTGDLNNSLDFDLARGDAVHAAREGTVVWVEVRNTVGGPKEEYKSLGNRISIRHDDGSIAEYLHLRPGGSVVEPGDTVAAGQLIGYAGATGFATGPHLHFHVFERESFDNRTTLQVGFATSDGQDTVLAQGSSYNHPSNSLGLNIIPLTNQ